MFAILDKIKKRIFNNQTSQAASIATTQEAITTPTPAASIAQTPAVCSIGFASTSGNDK